MHQSISVTTEWIQNGNFSFPLNFSLSEKFGFCGKIFLTKKTQLMTENPSEGKLKF